jgi:hypothetical protein
MLQEEAGEEVEAGDEEGEGIKTVVTTTTTIGIITSNYILTW